MIEFKKITYKNFQSAGNQGISVDLSRSMTTLVGGHNGAGKSTLLEAISYALFGKPLKKINLSGLINTINKKNMEVELTFVKNGTEYRIVRGQKPAKFEFYVGNDLVDQSASSKDYQAKIEYVLGMDYKLFTQIVVLNKEKYVPFMELDAASRRKVVEDILDISLFSSMNDIVKERAKTHSVKVNDVTFTRERLNERLSGKKRLLDEAIANTQDRSSEIEQNKRSIQAKIENEEREIRVLQEELGALSDAHSKLTALQTKRAECEKVSQAFKQSMESAEKTSKFYSETDVCPSCSSTISPDIKQKHLDECSAKIKEVRTNAQTLVEIYQGILSDISIQSGRVNRINTINSQIGLHRRAIDMLKSNLNDLDRSLRLVNESSKVDDIRKEYDEVVADIDKATQELQTLLQESSSIETCKSLLKDDGIKASVVRDYIDFINSQVNSYLSGMEFYLNITLDEEFNDKINSVNREGFTYDNLSTGQKTRVNLAVWLSLLEVASIKNSVVTNILFLDEILENLDNEGVSMFMRLVADKLPHKNTFVVTQRFDEFKEFFRSELKFKLVEGFTEIA